MLIASFFLTHKAFADTSCIPMYGGGTDCGTDNVSIEKDVVNPTTNTDVHDLGITDAHFAPGQTITFHITIRNNQATTLSRATVIDTFPQYMTYLSGGGNYDTYKRTLTFSVGNIAPNASQTFTVTGTVRADQLPSSQTFCMNNLASVTIDNNQSAQDSSQFCVQPTAAPGTTTTTLNTPPQVISSPATGPETLPLAGLLAMGGLGIFIKRLARKEHY